MFPFDKDGRLCKYFAHLLVDISIDMYIEYHLSVIFCINLTNILREVSRGLAGVEFYFSKLIPRRHYLAWPAPVISDLRI